MTDPSGPGRGNDPHQLAELAFPDVPRLELDQLLEQLMDRAHEVQLAQGRLRGLLRATQMIVNDLDLPSVLRRVVESARELVGARYAALGVIAADGHLAQFVHTGMPADAVDLIGHLPEGKGLLGALIDDPHPIRLARIGSDVRSTGFPPGHPPMDSFLGVPIRVRDTVFGNLYLSESTRGEFTAEDEELAKSLAAGAGAAIDNARLYEAAGLRQDWLRASATITHRLLSTDSGNPLQLIADTTREIADADLVTVVLPTADGPDGYPLAVAVADGPEATKVRGVRLSLGGSLSGRVFTSGEPLLVTRPDERTGLDTSASVEMDIGPMLFVPLLGTDRIRGVLTAGRRPDRHPFSADDLTMAAGFANQASIAIELAEARTEQQRLALLDDRDRIATELHDNVIQRLFAIGLSLQGVAATLGPHPANRRLAQATTDLDDTIREIRTSIFELQQPPKAAGNGCRARLLELATEHATGLGSTPSLRFSGRLDALPSDLVDDLATVAVGALAAVARDAAPAAVDIDVSAGPDQVTIEITAAGVWGIPGGELAELRHRAEARSGTLTVLAAAAGGNRMCWSVPIL
ncbi:GAF domain-containing sensor histidine kinase [Pseudonocardia sp. GCM10023141]|uniref:GAF domain-containing sensor histidine kinase n=1 Tax=Pseudonocardia sp. GCM10023141 TaxID=3252653 RepID=UPI00360E1948